MFPTRSSDVAAVLHPFLPSDNAIVERYTTKWYSKINQGELSTFRKLAKAYEGLSAVQIQLLLDRQDVMEICHGEKIQK